MRYILSTLIFWVFVAESTFAQDALKIAFSEGIKATVKVIEYEKKQSLKSIPKGYCVVITGKTAPLALWEKVKLESLALFLEYNPSLLSIEYSVDEQKNILCLLTSESQAQARESLKQFKSKYPKLENYLTKIEVLPTKSIYRIIPGIGYTPKINDITNESITKAERVPQDDNILFESDSVKVVASKIPRVNFLTHTTSERTYK